RSKFLPSPTQVCYSTAHDPEPRHPLHPPSRWLYLKRDTRDSICTVATAVPRSRRGARRIWAELKYREDRPVLTSMELVSKPSKRISMTWTELLRICSGRRAQYVKPLGLGEIAVVRTSNKEHEWLEAREALQLKLDGEVVCRVR
ncbi:hypothetical protein BC835DRAFT_1453338, partial [Cytidiella melzeri]